MGHYGDLYDSEREEWAKEAEKEIKKEFENLINKLDVKDKKFLNKIMNNIEDYQALDRLLSHKRK